MNTHYKVLFPDDCQDTPDGSIAERIKAIAPFRREGLNISKNDVFVEAERGDQGQGLAHLKDWIQKVEKTQTYNELASLDKFISGSAQKHDLWKHINSTYKGQKEITFWEFALSRHSRLYCYVDHINKTVLVIDSTFTANKSHKKANFTYLNNLAEDIYKATHDTNLFQKIRKDSEIDVMAQDTVSIMPSDKEYNTYLEAIIKLQEFAQYFENKNIQKTQEEAAMINYLILLKENQQPVYQKLINAFEQEKQIRENNSTRNNWELAPYRIKNTSLNKILLLLQNPQKQYI